MTDCAQKDNQTHSTEHALFMEWMQWLRVHHPKHGFMYDGIVCKEEWDRSSKHVLLVLKDYNEKGKYSPLNEVDINNRDDIKENIFNLRYYLQKGISKPSNWRTWNNAARWVYGILNSSMGNYPSFVEVVKQGDARHRSANMKKVAVIDVKKKPGKASCNKTQLFRYFAEYPESYSFLARQIALYGKLDFVICCGDGLFEIFKRIASCEPLKKQLMPFASKHDDYLITRDGIVVINFIHPLLLKKGFQKEEAYNSLMKTVQKAMEELSFNEIRN